MKSRYIIILHLVFWFIVLSMNYAFLIFRGAEIPFERYLNMTIKLALELIDFYIFYAVIVPRFFNRRKYGRFLLYTLLFVIVYTSFYAVVTTYSSILLKMAKSWENLRFQYIVAIYYVILYIFLGGLFKLAIDGFISHRQKLILEKQNIKSELALLRSQVNPHFLFNTLNTIHSFVNSKHPKAAEAVIRLSDIMRYMLYEAAREKITVEKEIEYLNSYIMLQNLRLEKSMFVEFRLKGGTAGILIPPMLFTPFVENAFKHGKKKDKETGITIDFEVGDNTIFFRIDNFIDTVKSSEIAYSKGFGLKNVKRRLDLLYPDTHKLEINEQDDHFIVSLQIEI
ncbi:sensor histidine kinase [Bacteroidota bacterium]